MVILGILLMLGTALVVVLIEGGSPFMYVNLSAFIAVFFLPFFASMAVWKWKELTAAWAAPFAKTARNAATAVKVWNFTEKMFYLNGLLVSVMGAVVVLANLGTDTSREMIGRGMAVAFIVPIYAIFCGMLARIFRERCAKG
jgi:flagellar motor component MotA